MRFAYITIVLFAGLCLRVHIIKLLTLYLHGRSAMNALQIDATGLEILKETSAAERRKERKRSVGEQRSNYIISYTQASSAAVEY